MTSANQLSKNSKRIFSYAVLFGITTGTSWLFPNTTICFLLGFVSVFFFVLLLKLNAKTSYFFLSGIILNSIGFYWLFSTIHDFGQFNIFLSSLGFLIFVLLSSIEFIIPKFIYSKISKSRFLRSLSLPASLSILIVESYIPKFFAWTFAHTTLPFKPLSLNASLFGTMMLTFFMFWICEFLCDFILFRKDKANFKRPSFIPLILFTVLLINGNCLNQKNENFKRTNVTLVQSLPTTELVDGLQMIKADVYKYFELTKEEIKDKEQSLIIWPESVITNLIHENISNVKTNYKLPYLGDSFPLIVGALSYNDSKQIFNSIFFVGKNGDVPLPYHKQILIPFGEYIPFVEYFPFLKKLTKLEGFFDRGKEVKVYTYKDKDGNVVKVSPFICYEELVPKISVDAANKGANLLVGLSNDGWFGKGVALKQHNMISSFRAIETDKFLIRSTHTGLTSIIDNKGNTITELPIYEDIAKTFRVPLSKKLTIYTKIKDIPLNLLNIFTILIFLLNFLKKSEENKIN